MKTEFLLQNKKLIQTILEPYHVHAKGKETIKNVHVNKIQGAFARLWPKQPRY
jgi:hypothetical protein